jgi:hypothetical protein
MRDALAQEAALKEKKIRDAEEKKLIREQTKEANSKKQEILKIKRVEAKTARDEAKAVKDAAKLAKDQALALEPAKQSKPKKITISKKPLNGTKCCLGCKKSFKSDSLVCQAQWRGCEECSNWYCFGCHSTIPQTSTASEFLCSICKKL